METEGDLRRQGGLDRYSGRQQKTLKDREALSKGLGATVGDLHRPIKILWNASGDY